MIGKRLFTGMMRAGAIGAMGFLLTVVASGPDEAAAGARVHGSAAPPVADGHVAGAGSPTSFHPDGGARVILAYMDQEKGYIQYGTIPPVPDVPECVDEYEYRNPVQVEAAPKNANRKRQSQQKEWDVLQNLNIYVPVEDPSQRPEPPPPPPPRLPGPPP